MSDSPHEQLARARKVQRIVAVLDAAFTASAIQPDSVAAVRMIVWAEPEHFHTAATIAGVRTPSVKTIAAVVEFYRERLRLAQTLGAAS